MACFPVQYQETYYKDVVGHRDEGLCKFAYFNGFVVGAACARLEPIPEDKQSHDDIVVSPNDTNNTCNSSNSNSKKTKDTSTTTPTESSSTALSSVKKRIYIMTLGVLAPYRGMEIGTQLIQSIFDHYEENKENGEYKDVVEIALHVQISNEDAIKFYTTRFGFAQGELVENYYRRIDPPHCYKLFKTIR
jgi:N-alpha-acetyltransferase 50